MSAIDNLPTVACLQTWIIGMWIIMDNRLGGVDNICVLGMRSQDQPLDTVRVADQHGTYRRHGVISKHVFITLWDNGALYSS